MNLEMFLMTTIRLYSLYVIVYSLGYFTCGEECGGTLLAPSGTIKTPKFTTLSNKTDRLCEWRIRLNSSTSQRIELNFKTFHLGGRMPRCIMGSSLEIFVGCSEHSIGHYCSSAVLPVIYSTDKCMKLRFRWKVAGNSWKFEALYRSKSSNEVVSRKQTGCGALAHQENVLFSNINSPGWPQPYPPYVECLWSLETRSATRMRLIVFASDIDSSSGCPGPDSLEIRVGTKSFVLATAVFEQHCGKKNPFFIDISASAIYIKFVTDGAGGAPGFMIGVVTYTPDEDESNLNVWIISSFVLLALTLFAKKVLSNRKPSASLKTNKRCTRQTIRSFCVSVCSFKWVRFSKPSFRRTRRTGPVTLEPNNCSQKYVNEDTENTSTQVSCKVCSGAKTNPSVEFDLDCVTT